MSRRRCRVGTMLSSPAFGRERGRGAIHVASVCLEVCPHRAFSSLSLHDLAWPLTRWQTEAIAAATVSLAHYDSICATRRVEALQATDDGLGAVAVCREGKSGLKIRVIDTVRDAEKRSFLPCVTVCAVSSNCRLLVWLNRRAVSRLFASEKRVRVSGRQRVGRWQR